MCACMLGVALLVVMLIHVCVCVCVWCSDDQDAGLHSEEHGSHESYEQVSYSLAHSLVPWFIYNVPHE